MASAAAPFADHFSAVAADYAGARPEYPDALFAWIASAAPATAQAWEAGCGSGQATRGLARHFAGVHATDPSAAQVAQARGPANVAFAIEPGERCSLADASVDAVCVAQALHWFDRYRFFATCERVLRPGGVLAAWTYQDIIFEDDLAEAAEKVRDDIDPYWPPERADVDMGYGDYVWPFEIIPTPRLWLTAEWNLPTLLGYFGSLSATGSYRAATGEDPVYAHTPALAEVWGDPQRVRTMRWPLILHLRRKPA